MDAQHLDFEQARAKHLLFKARLRAILYGIEVDEGPVLSQYECSLGKWIYSHALQAYGHLPQMLQLEKVHANIHTSAQKLIALYHQGKVQEARKGLSEMESVADELVGLLQQLEQAIRQNKNDRTAANTVPLSVKLEEFHKILNANIELDKRIKEQVKETEQAKERFELLAKATQDVVWDWDLTTNILWWNEGMQEIFGYPKSEIEPDIQSWEKRIHPEDKERVLKSIEGVIAHGVSNWSAQYRFLKADGSYAIVYDRAYALHNSEGKAYRMVGSMQDLTGLKQYEQKLLFSEGRFETLIDTLEEGITIHNDEGTITSANESAQKLLGLTLNELTGKTPFDPAWKAIHEDGSDFPGDTHPPYLAVNTKKRQVNQVMGIRRKDNTLAWVQVNSSPLLSPGTANLLGAVTSFFDITAIKQAEEELNIFKFLAELANDAFILMRADGSFAYLNTQAKKRWGYTDEEVLHIRVPDVDPIYQEDRFNEAFKLAQNQTIPVFETLHKRKDGVVFPVEINMKGITVAGEQYLFAVGRDITERKKAEDALRESEERFKLAIENTEAGVFDTDLINKTTIRSYKHAQIYGYGDNKEEWTVDKMASHIIPDDYNLAYETYLESIKTGFLDSSYRIKRLDGAIRWVNVVGKVYYNEKNEPIKIIGIASDITDKKALQKQKDEFISTVSHELKTPVTSIKAYNQFLKRSLKGDENLRNRDFLDRMDVQISRLQNLIRDLLDITRLENNKLALKKEPLELNILLKEVISDLQLITPTHQILITENTPITVCSDRDRIIQVITNLVTNSVKYSPQNEKVYVSLKKENSFAVCCIEDFGIGIPEEHHIPIFERFHQAGNINQQAGLNLGLGLYISKEIVRNAGGDIWLESTVGKGSRFYFSLPL